MKRVATGTRVRLKRPYVLLSGWCGTATMLFPDEERACVAIKDGYAKTGRTHRLVGDEREGAALALPEHWAVMSDQTPNPEHADAVRIALTRHAEQLAAVEDRLRSRLEEEPSSPIKQALQMTLKKTTLRLQKVEKALSAKV